MKQKHRDRFFDVSLTAEKLMLTGSAILVWIVTLYHLSSGNVHAGFGFGIAAIWNTLYTLKHGPENRG